MRTRDRWTILCAFTLCLIGPGLADAGLGSLRTSSSVTYTHDLNDNGAVAAPDRQSTDTSVPFGYGGFHLPEATISSGGVDSTAKAGLGYSQNPFLGTALVQPGTFVSQADPGNASPDQSSLTMDYDLRWDVTPARWGPPLLSNFTVPFLAIVGAGGEASVDIEVNWGKQNGATFTPMRSQYTKTMTFGAGTTLTSIQAAPAAFSPPLIGPSDDYRIHGHIKFGAKNATEPVQIFPSVATPTVSYNMEIVPGSGQVPDLAPLPNFPPGQEFSPATASGVIPVTGVAGSALDFSTGGLFRANVPTTDSFTAIVYGKSNGPTWNTGSELITADGPSGISSFSIDPVPGTALIQATLVDSTGQSTSIGPAPVNRDLGIFNQFALTYDDLSRLATLYVNGQSVGSSPLTAPRGSGNAALSLGSGLNGALDEFLLLPHVLDATVINGLFDVGETDPLSLRELDNLDPFFGASPEPSSAVLLGICLVGVVSGRRRRH